MGWDGVGWWRCRPVRFARWARSLAPMLPLSSCLVLCSPPTPSTAHARLSYLPYLPCSSTPVSTAERASTYLGGTLSGIDHTHPSQCGRTDSQEGSSPRRRRGHEVSPYPPHLPR
ncbi:uncharacterized protein IWZ02DRAFT_293411 [Phyllosticta citriasiana]|uniref:uncharacterized protein n=1 Tax=Phyllosticta citriasiana TaxID=595635 RepID=UPI0030FD9350